MSAERLPAVALTYVREFVGDAAFERARPYASNGSVLRLTWDAGERVLDGVVAGTEPRPYTCEVFLTEQGGRWHPVSSLCTCPIGTRCKHAAALMLASARGERDLPSVRNPLMPAVPLGASAAAASAAAAPARSPERRPEPRAPEWRRILTGSTGAGVGAGAAVTSPTVAHPPNPERTVPLALQFEVRERVRRSLGRWGHANETTQTATAKSSGLLVITLRIASPGARGWVAAETDWSKIGYDLSGYRYDPHQARWFGEFAALARASQPRYIGQDAKRLVLEEFESPLLWTLLDDARARGIELVGQSGSVVRADSAQISARLEESARTGDVRVLAGVTFDGKSDPSEAPAAVGAIGRHGLFSIEWVGAKESVIRLGPLAHPLGAEARALLEAGELVVPASDRDEFFTEFYPRLADVAFDGGGSVELPTLEPPTLVLTLGFEPEHALRLIWEWQGDTHDALFEVAVGREVRRVLDAGETKAGYPDTTVLREFDAADFVERVVPELEQLEGVRIETIGKRPDYRELTEAPTFTVRAVESDERDWLDLGFTVQIGDYTVPFGPLFKALSGGKARLMLVDGTHLSLNRPEFDRLRELIAEAGELKEWETGKLALHRTQVELWRDFEDLADFSEATRAWQDQVKALTDAPPAAPSPPAGLTAELREYQLAGFSWLSYLYEHRLGGILADDMGLGKTLQTLALILASIGEEPAELATLRDATLRGAPQDPRASRSGAPWLVVAPASVVSNWVAEAARFAPGLRVASVTRTQLREKNKLADLANGHDVIVMSYNLFRLDFDDVEDVRWAGLVLDEAQFVKNHRSRAHECAKALDAPFKLAITGTPLENNVLELWSILDIVAPGLFPSIRRFTEQYVRPLSHVRGPDVVPAGISTADAQRVIARLRRRVRPFLLRRTKALVAPELPAKQEQVIRVELAPKHRRLYEQFLQRERQKLLGLVKSDLEKQKFILFRSLTLLRMLALDASLIDEQYAGVPSAKLDALLENLDEVVAEGHRALVFSQFTSYLGRVEQRLEQAGIDYEYLDGSTTNRAEVISRFKSGTAPVFLISLKAGGFGINLTEADYVYLLDPWWNPASEAQAVDRAHRIGQSASVNVYRLVADGTIEDKVMKLRDEKAELFGQVLDDDGTFSELLTADDIAGLLEL
ncbi:DEAD/DEAH box helicase [Gryllotalpicola daejeonensis]|uniref:DEAD/DEAH box helicase n=1 Tax=Gryllotalpicola daejeonensis TaxID=993087 RepID=UPI0031DA07AC